MLQFISLSIKENTINSTPIKIINETSGKNSVTIEYYLENNRYRYILKAVFDKRSWAKYPHKTDPDYPDIPTARYAAMKTLESWCTKNSLKKAFYSTIQAFQPELWD